MKIKKILSFILICNIFFNCITPVFADTLFENERYEVFEGRNLAINNILEENKIEATLSGDTLVNFANYSDISSFYRLNGTVNEEGYIELSQSSNYRNFFLKKDVINVKPDTKYTFVVDILENTLVKSNGKTDNCIFFGKSNPGNEPSYWEDFNCLDGGITGIYKFTLNTKKDFSNVTVGDRGFVDSNLTGKIKFRYMIIEGDYTDCDIAYFRGMKSVGENNGTSLDFQVLSSGKNLFNKNSVLNEFIEMDTGKILPSESGLNRTTDWITCKPNTTYTVSGGERNRWLLKSSDGRLTYIGSTSGNATPTITTLDDTVAFKCYVIHRNVNLLDSIQIEEGSNATNYESYVSDVKQIQLLEPLRGVREFVKDKILKKNGKWFIERNCAELTINGDEDIIQELIDVPKDTNFIRFNIAVNGILSGKEQKVSSNKLPYSYIYDTDTSSRVINYECISNHSNRDNELSIIIRKSNLNTYNIEGFKIWLSENPLKIVYKLENPIYEEISFNNLQLYLNTTYITSDASIKPIITVTIDRINNRVEEFIDKVKINPILSNISSARMFINMLPESLYKDQLQAKLNEIFSEDMVLDRLSATANLDVYIKSENILMMSLDTNTVTFEDYSGVEELELENAINISINSSLPYQLNAYIVGDIINKDKDKTLDLDVLNIKDSSELEYKKFDSINNKLVLLDNVEKGNNINHNIDLKLTGNKAHDADVYKTTIKFEAEQK